MSTTPTQRPDQAAKHLRRQRARGVTLFEVLIVVAILSMVAGGVAVVALPRYKKAQIEEATRGCRLVRQAVVTWQMTNNDSSCPTVSQLVEDKFLDKGANTNDPWNQPFTISCVEDDAIVSSNGPDKKKGTGDDISIPKQAGGSAE